MTVAAALCIALYLRGGTGKQRIVPAPRCDVSACPPLNCAAGLQSKVIPGECCPSCVAVAEHVAEPIADQRAQPPKLENPCARQRCEPCPKGMRPEAAEGECCPRCIAANVEACERGRHRYEARSAELEAELRSCASDDDCMVASFGDACRANCPTPLNKVALGSVVSQLQAAAAEHCQECAPQPFECPRRNTDSARCVGGRCEFALPTAPTRDAAH